ncbi:GNAT family N-acetyltransferase [Pseudomonas sp. GCEP-101]|uniref:GNAT family N-acetyltransferase n=1 Tax=Pseudomonas sp. GCEP-101 TaxID=2974552 RepID=UPI00223BBDB8|nr:GNAT family protein [Pseudomonas sp. GCEP-101]
MNEQPLLNWHPAASPERRTLTGRYINLVPLDAALHGDDLWQALQGRDCDPALWDYLPYGPFPERAPFDAWLAGNAASNDPLFFAVIDRESGRAVGLLSYLRIFPRDGSIEIGHIAYGRVMQRSPASTEAVYLLARWAFEMRYRRLEWKCNALNARSMRAAERLGFVYEGTFRQATVVKDRNRDTAWFSIIDSEWPRCEQAFEAWLGASNFDGQGRQRTQLADLRLR